MTIRNYLGYKKTNQMIFGEAGKGKICHLNSNLFKPYPTAEQLYYSIRPYYYGQGVFTISLARLDMNYGIHFYILSLPEIIHKYYGKNYDVMYDTVNQKLVFVLIDE